MKVLVLGANGMLGQELALAFADHKLTTWDREECDVLSDACEGKIKALAPNLIVNAIAYNDVDRAEEEGKEMAFQLNAEAPGNLARLAQEIRATFVHYGTDMVFDGTKGDYSEDDEPNPLSVYGASKLNGEQAVFASGARTYVIRLARLFGKPAVSEGSKKSFVDLMLDLATKKDHLDLVDDEIASPTYAPDLAAATRHIIETMPPGLYHAANAGKCNWYEFARETFRLRNINIDITPVPGKNFPRPACRPHDASLVSTKLPEQRSWQSALAEYLNG